MKNKYINKIAKKLKLEVSNNRKYKIRNICNNII